MKCILIFWKADLPLSGYRGPDLVWKFYQLYNSWISYIRILNIWKANLPLLGCSSPVIRCKSPGEEPGALSAATGFRLAWTLSLLEVLTNLNEVSHTLEVWDTYKFILKNIFLCKWSILRGRMNYQINIYIFNKLLSTFSNTVYQIFSHFLKFEKC